MIGRRGSRSLGVGISTRSIRAIVLADGRIEWSYEEDREDQALEPALSGVLAEATRLHGRLAVAIAVGPGQAQFRYLQGLPSIRDPRMLASIVQQSAGRYFRQNGVPLVTTPVDDGADGGGWAGAIEEPVLEAIANAGREHRLVDITVAPSAALLGHAAPDCMFAWQDADLSLELSYRDRHVAECRCRLSESLLTGHGQGMVLVPALHVLGERATQFADAYAAARGGRSTKTVVRLKQGLAMRRRRHVLVAGTALAGALAFAAAAPTLAMMRAERLATARLDALGAAVAPTQRVERSLSDGARLLAQLVAFHHATVSKTVLLAKLSCAIKEPAMLLSLHVGPSEGVLTALAPSAASLLAMLDSVPEAKSLAIVGSVTQEVAPLSPPLPSSTPSSILPDGGTTAHTSLERVTVRFQWHADARGSRPLVERCKE